MQIVQEYQIFINGYRDTFKDESVYDYMRHLFSIYRGGTKSHAQQPTRKATATKNTASITRSNKVGISLVNQFHNELQMTLKEQLDAKYGVTNVKMEEDFVDLILEYKTISYEQK